MKILCLLRSLGQLLLISIGPGPHFMRKSWGENKFRLLETEQHAKKPFLNFILNMVTPPSEKAAPFIAFRKSAGTPAATDSLRAWKDRLAFKAAAFYRGQTLLMGSTPHRVSPWARSSASTECWAWQVPKALWASLSLSWAVGWLLLLTRGQQNPGSYPWEQCSEYSEPILDRISPSWGAGAMSSRVSNYMGAGAPCPPSRILTARQKTECTSWGLIPPRPRNILFPSTSNSFIFLAQRHTWFSTSPSTVQETDTALPKINFQSKCPITSVIFQAQAKENVPLDEIGHPLFILST